jgi:hypothetical protein
MYRSFASQGGSTTRLLINHLIKRLAIVTTCKLGILTWTGKKKAQTHNYFGDMNMVLDNCNFTQIVDFPNRSRIVKYLHTDN